jgi:Skp family chaperone for outer membrane proteins
MKTFRLIAVSFIFAAIFAVSAFAQATAQPAAGRIGLVNTFAFGGDDKGAGGITKYKNAMTSLDAEFKTVFDKLKTMDTRRAALAKEIQAAQNQPSTVPAATTALQAKVDEYQALEVQMKREQEDAKAKYERRSQQVIGPIYGDILKAMSEFAKQKGYALILDGAKLEQADILLGFDEKYNVTTEFITFYNARPAGAATASTTTPQ